MKLLLHIVAFSSTHLRFFPGFTRNLLSRAAVENDFSEKTRNILVGISFYQSYNLRSVKL